MQLEGGRGLRGGGGGGGSQRKEDQLEVSEWTLPGPSVGEVTDEGVGASGQPPFAWQRNNKKKAAESVQHEGKVLLKYCSTAGLSG